MSGRVVVVGSLNVDLVATASRLPTPGETVTGATYARHHGGKGGNQAVAAARLGAPTFFVGAIGNDEFGAEARAALVAEGVDVAGLHELDGPTGVALILVDAGGENLISVASGANARLRAEDVEAALVELAIVAGDVVLVGHEIPTAAARTALRLAAGAGATTILNPAPAGGLDRATFSFADILTPNRSELAELVRDEAARTGQAARVGERPETAARVLLAASSEGAGVRQAIVVTLGAGGAVAVTADQPPVDVPAPAVTVADAVGAGDALNGALAAALAAGLPLVDATRRSVAAAALSTTAPGAREGMPTAAQVDAHLAGR